MQVLLFIQLEQKQKHLLLLVKWEEFRVVVVNKGQNIGPERSHAQSLAYSSRSHVENITSTSILVDEMDKKFLANMHWFGQH